MKKPDLRTPAVLRYEKSPIWEHLLFLKLPNGKMENSPKNTPG